MYRYKPCRYARRFCRKNHEKVARVEGSLQLRFAEEKKNLISILLKFHVSNANAQILPREESWKCLWSDRPREAQNMVLGLFSKS